MDDVFAFFSGTFKFTILSAAHFHISLPFLLSQLLILFWKLSWHWRGQSLLFIQTYTTPVRAPLMSSKLLGRQIWVRWFRVMCGERSYISGRDRTQVIYLWQTQFNAVQDSAPRSRHQSSGCKNFWNVCTCDRCYTHMFLGCTSLNRLWSEVFQILSKATGRNLVPNIFSALFGVLPFPLNFSIRTWLRSKLKKINIVTMEILSSNYPCEMDQRSVSFSFNWRKLGWPCLGLLRHLKRPWILFCHMLICRACNITVVWALDWIGLLCLSIFLSL